MFMVLFWLSLFLIFYVYILYAVVLVPLSLLFRRDVKKNYFSPSVSIIIAAYNEEGCIKETIENKLNLDYPGDRLEIIVVSDGSDDKTDEIVRECGTQNVRLLRQEPRQGKTAALNMAASAAKGEIIVFSDSNSIYFPNALRELVANFSDGSVGYVTGKMVYVNPEGSGVGDGCSAYMRYENLLRSMESRVSSIVGVDGGIDAVRKELFSPMSPDHLPDLILPLRVVEKGYRVLYDPTALLSEYSLNRPVDEYRMRVRVSLRALHAIKEMRHLLNPFRYGLLSWQLISHKLLRYNVFILLAALYVSNLLIAGINGFYAGVFLLQSMFYIFASSGYFLEKRKISLKMFQMPFYFCLVNLASAHAFLRFINNEKQVLWTPRRG
jgi:cellulose synthase/poly-beta-1,6-N-acetylglucosamine synthase-like glycosyltransferase